MSTKGIGHDLSYWTPVAHFRPAGYACEAIPKSKWPAYFADEYWNWTGKSANAFGLSLKGCERAVIRTSMERGWAWKAGRIVSYGFFVLHYALRRHLPQLAQNRLVSPLLWAISLVPVAMGIAKVWCRYGHRYYVYSSETGDDGIPLEAKCTLDEKVFGEWGKIDRLPAAEAITAENHRDLTPEQMAEPIKKYVVAWQTERRASICMKLQRQEEGATEQKVYTLYSTNGGNDWIEGDLSSFLSGQMFIARSELCEKYAKDHAGFQALSSIAQGGIGKDQDRHNSHTWELAK